MVHDDNVVDPSAPPVGIPTVPFPRWFRCSICNYMAPLESGLFKLVQDKYRSDRTRYQHTGCTKASNPTAFPVRFLMACREGHLTDFPWVNYVHQGRVPCKPSQIRMREFGVSGDVSDIFVECMSCQARRPMRDAFDPEYARNFTCSGHHPHLRQFDGDGCEETPRVILLGASNSWFPLVATVISLPVSKDRLEQIIDERWSELSTIPSLDTLKWAMTQKHMLWLAGFDPDKVWKIIEAKRNSAAQASDDAPIALKTPEWKVFSSAAPTLQSDDFKIRKTEPPYGYDKYFEDTVLVERIREVRALYGFNRIESKGDFADAIVSEDSRCSPLSKNKLTWLPVTEVRGEGIFVRLKEDVISAWESKADVAELEQAFFESHKVWRRKRNIRPEQEGFPGIRYVLIHSLAHALMRQIVLDCGYTAASIRERIYCKHSNEEDGPMAGFLIYTAASDSEGTLGGLVDLGNPVPLGRHMRQSLENIRICATDPLCSEHLPSDDGHGIHGASCHACLFAPETSCEKGNRYLDRSVLIATMTGGLKAFFNEDG